jgi:predicted membrane protein (TIGR00267 family)
MRATNALRGLWHQIWEDCRLADTGNIARRYFAMNAFDGVLTMIGVLMGNLTAGVETPRIVVSTGLSTCVAMGVSGLWGAWLTEAAERKRDLRELSRQTLTDLNHTRIARSFRLAVVMVALVDGLSPFLAALFILIPFFAVGLFPAIRWVYYTSIGLALITLFGLGLFLGRISHENLVGYGIKTVIAGIISIVISCLLNG